MRKPLNIIYIGELYGTCLMRMKALEKLGHNLIGVDVVKYQRWGGRLLGYPFRKFLFGWPIYALNREILNLANKIRPDMVWVDKGRMITSQTLQNLKNNFDSILLHFTPDPAITYHKSRHFSKSIPIYDYMVTTKSYELDLYKENNVRNLIFVQQSYDEIAHIPQKLKPEERKKYQSDVAFIGHWEPMREEYLLEIYKLGFNLAIWGPWYDKKVKNKGFLKKCWRGNGLFGDEYAKGWSGSKIGLCFLSKLAPDVTTSRSLEIPACGCFMLAERTKEHKNLFKENKEAVYFSNKEEMIQKVIYYLKNNKKRNLIAKNGRKRCFKSGYSYKKRLQKIFENYLVPENSGNSKLG